MAKGQKSIKPVKTPNYNSTSSQKPAKGPGPKQSDPKKPM